MIRASDVHDQLTAAGIPVTIVRMNGLVAEVVYGPEATPEQQAQGEQIKTDFIAEHANDPDV